MTAKLNNTLAVSGRIVLKSLAIALLGWTFAQLTACNTTEGVGKDVKAVGEGLEDAAQDAKD